MPGSFDLDGSSPSLAGQAIPLAVFFYDGESLTLLPNIWCERIDYREGPEPPVARFRYAMDDLYALNLDWPSRIGDVWPLDAQGPYVVQDDDRLVVAGQNPDGSPLFLFDGFAQIPQVDVSPRSEGANFVALGVACRAWDDTIHTRVQRDADTPEDTSGDSDFEVHLPCRFNPADQRPGSMGGILANSTADALYTQDGKDQFGYPVFLEPLLEEREIAEEATYLEEWYVSDAMLYLLAQPNEADDYVTWPDSGDILALLESLAPPPGSTVFNRTTAVKADCVIRDYDATGKTLPEALAEIIGYAGFELTWDLDSNADGAPETFLRFYRRDGAATGAPKQVYLDTPGNALVEGSLNNVTAIHLSRDTNGLVNAWRTETGQRQTEITVVLAPLFEPEAADATSPARDVFKSANLTTATAETRRKYRWYGADECGDGHWNMTDDEWSVQPLDLSPIFPNTPQNTKSYCTRYRPGSDTLIARDSNGRPLKATLEVFSQDNVYSGDPYVQTEPGADGWLTIKGGWKLLSDRLGIEITAPDPEEWITTNLKIPKIAAISRVALAGSSKWQPFVLRLTTVIEGDRRIKAEAPKRIASPTQFARWRSADAKDHFQYCEISPGSIHYETNNGDGTNPVVIRDDTKRATIHAQQLRSSHEMPRLAGSIRIPGITVAYQVGDRISSIVGRNISLQTNIGASQGETPVYPWIVGVSYELDPHQYTVLHLSDRRAEVRNSH